MSGRLVSGRLAVVALVLVLSMVLVGPLATGAFSGAETAPGAGEGPENETSREVAPEDSPVSDDLDGQGGSPQAFVALSLLGGAAALVIMGVQWFRTRPPDHRSG